MYLFDTFTNFLSGLGVFGRDKMTAFSYASPVWTRQQLEAAFQSDWIARKAISIPAQDATREWRAWQAKAEQIELIEATENRLQIQLKLQAALTKSRLYGGCCMLIGVEGDMASELDPETIKKDGLQFVHILAPHQLHIEEMVKDIADPFYGQPRFYTVYDDTQKYGSVKIHPSRMVRLVGMDTPDPLQNFGWGDPVMQTIHDAVSAAGTVTQSVAAMIGEAKFDVIKIPGLTEIFSTTDGTNRLVKRFSEANVAKSVINAVVLDAEEEWERIGVNFGGMPEILQMYLQIAAGAADIPATRFLGRSPAGLNATGDSDLINYYDRIASDQALRLSPALELLDKAIIRSALGSSDPDIFYEWNSLWQTTEAEKATIAKQKADAAKVDVDTGLVPFTALVKGRCNQLIEDGTYPGLEAAIAEAEAAGEMPEESPAMIMLAKQAENDLAAQGEEDDAPFGKKPPPKKKANGNGKYADSGGSCTIIPFGDRLVPWDELLHPRDEEGKFTSGGSAEFVSPSVKSGLDFKRATKELESRQQTRLRAASRDINDKLGITGAREVDIIGAWKDGAENSIMSRTDADWNKTVLSAVMKGHLADQKSVLVFQQQERGVGVLAQFEATGPLNTIHKNLLKDGIENHTVVPHETGATIYMVSLDGSNLADMNKAAERYGKGNPLYYQTGRAEFIGDFEYDKGSDREQRDRARRVYESIIEQSSVEEAESVWQDVHNYWSAPADQAGYALTPTAILAEHPNVKPNSVNVTDAALLINGRAGEILKRDVGVESIDENNTTEEIDEYLANVIKLELREGLIGGASGEHWYDNTIKEAMQIAEGIYPGMATDPHKRFMYTTALAITSQGETVGRNVELADQAYTHFLEHGVFPTDLKAKKASIRGNLKKVNEAIAEFGGGEKGIAKLREFFNTQMTARELTAATGVEPGATLKDDIVYGSAMLGPKIGQGFYQNLNGNFTPITMDLWFMRGWGRITNTGVQDTDMVDQLERVDRALNEAGIPVEADRDATIKVARDIFEQHEKDYAAHQDEYDSGEREKSELVLASERLVLYADGKMVEQPKNGSQRKWITGVFNRALEKLKQDHNLDLTPAGAQATWWWPEKILWESMGVRGKKRDTDYAKSLRELAAKKGVR